MCVVLEVVFQAADKKREKKRQARKKKAGESERREEEEVVRRQGEAVRWLSEREKRALAAERRLAVQHFTDSSVQRCDVCVCDCVQNYTSFPELEFAAVVGVVWLVWFHSTDWSISTARRRVCESTEQD